MKLTQLRYFQGICRWGSLSRAARELHISQSVLSGTIKELEEKFGVLLFSRSGRGLVLPPEPEVAVIPVEDLPAARVCLVRKEGGKLSPCAGQFIRMVKEAGGDWGPGLSTPVL